MNGGEPSNDFDPSTSLGNGSSSIIDQFSALSFVGGGEDVESSVDDWKTVKDPRKIARKYQMDLCKKALEENIIVYLGTGCGKTHIAVLLIYEMGHLIKRPQKKVCVFLAPTVALVQQQAKVIQDSIDFKVGTYCGTSRHLKTHRDWEKEIESCEVLVMTPQILLHNLSHCFIRTELIALLIFDECHHAQCDSNHPYAQIMKVFYKSELRELPRIFGMTASPILGKDASISGLEAVLHAKVYTVEDQEDLEQFVASPKVKIYYYGPVTGCSSLWHSSYCKKLEEIKHQCVSKLSRESEDNGGIQSTKKALYRMHCNIIFCLEKLGLWGALQACSIQIKGGELENTLIGSEENCNDYSICDRYLAQAASMFTHDWRKDGIEAGLSCVTVLKEPLFSKKLLRLVGILSTFRSQPSMKCIVFVNRIVVARALSYLIQNLKILSSWKCEFLVGVHSGLKRMSRKKMNAILEKFRSGELNLLVATKVGEEGLDIQTCCLVIRFDLPETVASFIQSRGRARMPQSEYAFLVDSDNEKELQLIENFKKGEDQMNKEIAYRLSKLTVPDFEERTYQVNSTGATISSVSSISLLHHYCSKLPRDEYFNPKPEFFYFDDVEGTVCHIILPSNAPVHQIVGLPQPSIEAAKRDACLLACKELHERGALTDHLLPDQNEENEGTEYSSDSENSDDEASRRELHEMLVPATLTKSWSTMENVVSLYSYIIKFNPHPEDRLYKQFGLFLKEPLPEEAMRMKLDLHLDRGRFVKAELVTSGVANFNKYEIQQAQMFQEMWLKVILDRKELIPEYVSLGKNDWSNPSSSTFYLLLPAIQHEKMASVIIDWKLINKCLSSPTFTIRELPGDCSITSSDNQLLLANGPKSIEDIVNSLVYVPCKHAFFFISQVLQEKNGYSPFKDTTSQIEHYAKRLGFHLSYPEQPLLKAKQLFHLENLLRKKGHSESREKEEHFVEIPPEICQLKIIGFSKDVGSSLSLLPSFMHRLQSLLVAVELKYRLSASFPEGDRVAADRVFQALTTERCNEHFSLERLEVLGDAFLKFAVGRHLFLLNSDFDEGQLTRKRSNLVNNSNLFKLATKRNLQVYIRDQPFEPCQFFALGRSCPLICNKEVESTIHSPDRNPLLNGANDEVRCNKNHHWLYKKTVADVVEALVGAFLVDSGFKGATAFLKWIGIEVEFEAEQVSKMCTASTIFMPLTAQIDLASLENLLGYHFLHKGLLLQAFVHPSYKQHRGGCYQRLEFLGDAVMDFLITSYLYSVYPQLKPGQLTDLRSQSVNNNAFAEIAVQHSFHKFILCDSNSLCESMNKYANSITVPAAETGLVESIMSPKVLGDLVESSIGAILLDTGFNLNLVWDIMLSFLNPDVSFSKLQLNPIRELQELCQSQNWDLQFPSVRKDGKCLVEAKVSGNDFISSASATNRNRKAAIRIAAEQVLSKLKAQGYKPKSKSLEEVLKSFRKMEAKLIGYDETPVQVITTVDDKVHHFNEEPKIARMSRIASPSPSPSNAAPKIRGGSLKESAKKLLYNKCVANCWEPPLFVCCKESGPSHRKEFTFKVVIEIEEASTTTLECLGEPRLKKKDAAEHAAEGALWYLSHEGF